jgi:pSer/pThr/pTyr-binding forkhead associated (FHA) protein
MPLITLRYKGKVLQEYPINIGQTLTIGRNDSNDIVIDNLAVSGKHARIDSVSASFIITDLESTNGTFVNEELIASHGLRNNDVILIGKHELLFDRSDLEKKATDQNEETPDDKTRHIETAEYQELINKTTGKTAASSPGAAAQVSPDEGGGFFSRLLKKIFG